MHELVAGDSFSVAQQRRDDIYTAHREAIDVRERAGQWDRRQSVTLRAPATAQPEEVRCACVCLLACVCVCVSLSLSLSLSAYVSVCEGMAGMRPHIVDVCVCSEMRCLPSKPCCKISKSPLTATMPQLLRANSRSVYVVTTPLSNQTTSQRSNRFFFCSVVFFSPLLTTSASTHPSSPTRLSIAYLQHTCSPSTRR